MNQGYETPRLWRVEWQSAIGLLRVWCSERGVSRVWLPGLQPKPPAGRVEWMEGPAAFPVEGRIDAYLEGKRPTFDLPLDLEGTPFALDVWLALGEIPTGETVTYGQLAARLGRPNAVRAVGTLLGKNPVPLLLPCHRVWPVGNGQSGGYVGGIELKRWLMAMERRCFVKQEEAE